MHWKGDDTYNVVEHIGKGAFALVYKIATKHDGELFAAKELEKRRFMKNGVLDQKIHNELLIMKDLRHVSHQGFDTIYLQLTTSTLSLTS